MKATVTRATVVKNVALQMGDSGAKVLRETAKFSKTI